MLSSFFGSSDSRASSPAPAGAGESVASLKAQVAALRQQLARTAKGMEFVVKDRVESATRRLQDQNTELVTALTKARTEAGQAKAAEEKAKLDLVQLHADTGMSEKELRERVEDMRAEVLDTHAALHRAMARAEAAQAKVSGTDPGLQSQVAALQAQLAAAEARESGQAAQLRKAQAQVASLRTETEAIDKRCKKAIAECAAMRVKARQSDELFRTLEANLEAANDTAERAKRALEAQRTELRLGREASARLERTEALLREATAEASKAKEEAAAARAEAAVASEAAAQAAANRADAVKSACSARMRARTSLAAIRSIRRASVAAGHGDPLSSLAPGARRRLTVCGVDSDSTSGMDDVAEHSPVRGAGRAVGAEDAGGEHDGEDLAAGGGAGSLRQDDADGMSDAMSDADSHILDLDEFDAACGLESGSLVGSDAEDEEMGVASPGIGRSRAASSSASLAGDGDANGAAAGARGALSKAVRRTLAGADQDAAEAFRERLAAAQEAKLSAEAAAEAARSELAAREARVRALEAAAEAAGRGRSAAEAEANAARTELGRVQAARQALVQQLVDLKGNLRVIARVRPLAASQGEGSSSKGGAGGEGAAETCAATVLGDDRIRVRQPASSSSSSSAPAERTFAFDRVFGPESTQEAVFDEVRPIVEGVLGGVSATIFAYGQTGAGKTHTMMGSEALPGVTPRAVRCLIEGASAARAQLGAAVSEDDDVDQSADADADADADAAAGAGDDAAGVAGSKAAAGSKRRMVSDAAVEVGMLEIYRETLRDLLSDDDGDDEGGDSAAGPRSASGSKAAAGSRGGELSIHQKRGGAVYVQGLTFRRVGASEDADGVIATGLARRAVAATAMNADSSRSHLVTVVRFSATDASAGTSTSASLFLVDLAGSERLKKSAAEGERRAEAQAINKSLSALGDVLSALQAKSTHVPFRNSKLTHLLMSALAPGGGCRATMIVQASPAERNAQETTCTLAFGRRAASVELGKVSKAVVEAASGSDSSEGSKAASKAEARASKLELALRKERAAHAKVVEELALAQRQARALKSAVVAARGGANAGARSASARKPADGRRARTVQYGASRSGRPATGDDPAAGPRTSVESAMEAALEWLPAAMPSSASSVHDSDADRDADEETASLLVIDAVQVVGLVVRTGQSWPAELANISEQVFGLLRILLALFQWQAIALTASMVIVWASLINAGLVAWAFAYNKHQWIFPIRTLGVLVAFATSIGFIPLLEQLLLAIADPSSLTSDSVGAVVLRAAAAVSAVLFVPFALTGSLLVFEGDPGSTSSSMRAPSGSINALAALYAGIAWIALGTLVLDVVRRRLDGDELTNEATIMDIAVPWVIATPVAMFVGLRAVIVREAMVEATARDLIDVLSAVHARRQKAAAAMSPAHRGVRFGASAGVLRAPSGRGSLGGMSAQSLTVGSIVDAPSKGVPGALPAAEGGSSHEVVTLYSAPRGKSDPDMVVDDVPGEEGGGATDEKAPSQDVTGADTEDPQMRRGSAISTTAGSIARTGSGTAKHSRSSFAHDSGVAPVTGNRTSSGQPLNAAASSSEVKSSGRNGLREVGSSLRIDVSARHGKEPPATDQQEAVAQPVFSADKALLAVVQDCPRARIVLAKLMTSPVLVELAARSALRWRGLSTSAKLAACFVIYEAGIACFPSGAGVRIHFARTVEATTADTHRALSLLRAAASCGPAFNERFAIFHRLKEAEQSRQTTSLGKSAHGLGSADYLEFKKLEKLATSSHIKAIKQLKRIWGRVAQWERQGTARPSETAMKPLAKRIRHLAHASDRATSAYVQLVSKYPRATPLLRQFGCFLLEVRSRPDGADALFARADEVEDEDSTVGLARAESGSSAAPKSVRSHNKIRDDDFRAVADLQRGVGMGVLVMAGLMIGALGITVIMLDAFQSSINSTYMSAQRAERMQQGLYGARSVQLASAGVNDSLWE
ncbi:hypothetical protein FNF29_04261 [Cafeteria roenbergensis]|uniref:Kinesin motor domain-containing protein n=1 Tax=Cafeteria roenbergensis TaxID=33653 RepID=A0A5A8CFQ1_CAFRO|nr:hypothetical protein FNF29_04261 [Cafeteria roenbergensis]|eukprot:KAA0151855.1 hypothetical protein FNF29_04261 [Cafeteria roenbergensis]